MHVMQKIHPLRAIREAHNLTREQLAQEIGVGSATIKRAERGESISLESRRRLCTRFERTSEELGLVYSNDPTKQSNGEEGKSDVMSPATYGILAQYLQQQRLRLFDAMAPGASALRVGEIVEHDSLFIPPPWRLLHSSIASQNLTDYLMESLRQKQRILLLGDAGQGKTTILKLVFTRLADRFLEDSSSPLPIYIPLREHSSFSESALDILWMHVGEEFPLPYEEFASLVRNNQIAFLFDGFDEMRGEITQRSINERAACKIFRYPSVLSCRKSFFDFYLTMSPLQELYPQQVELQPLAFNDPVTHYIAAFCQWQQHAGRMHTASSEKIINTIQMSPELQDLAQRPLLLMMILDVLTDSKEILDGQWSITTLYKKYSERWLKREASKPDSVLKWSEKATLLQEVAWITYMGSSASPYSVSTFTHSELHMFVKSAFSRYHGITEAQLLDDLCFRTLLGAAEGSNYAFLHKSFQEYYVASYVFRCMCERDLQTIEHVLQGSLPFDVATYLKKMLKECSLLEKATIATNLIAVYQRNRNQAQEPTTRRQQATYYLSNLRTEPAIRFLEQVCDEEPNKWVQRGIMLGLALYSGRAEMLERYIQIIRNDREAASINIRYHLIYYGDQVGDINSFDSSEQTISCPEKTVAALFRHLQNVRYKNGWALDVLTLSALLELQGLSILDTHFWYKPFLKAFLDQDHRDQILLQEKGRLKQFLEGALLGKH